MDRELEKIRKRNTWLIVVSAALILLLNVLFPKDKTKATNQNWESSVTETALLFKENGKIIGKLPLTPAINDSLAMLQDWETGISRRKAMLENRNLQIYLVNNPQLVCYWAEGELAETDSIFTIFPGGALEYQKAFASQKMQINGVVANQLPHNEPVAAFEMPSGKWLGLAIPNLDSTSTVEVQLDDIGQLEIRISQPAVDWVTLRYPMICWLPNLATPEDALRKHYQIISELVEIEE